MLQRSVKLNNRAKVHKQYGNGCCWSCRLPGNAHAGFHLARMTLMFSETRRFCLRPDVSWQHPGRNQASPPAKGSPSGLKNHRWILPDHITVLHSPSFHAFTTLAGKTSRVSV